MVDAHGHGKNVINFWLHVTFAQTATLTILKFSHNHLRQRTMTQVGQKIRSKSGLRRVQKFDQTLHLSI